MRLSIVIPACNEAAFIGKCLDSIFAELQGKPYDVEVIVVDNASTDRTAEIAKSYPQVKLYTEPKPGANRARQLGFIKSTGELVASLDADVLLPPGWFDTVFQEFESNPKLVALSGPYIYYDVPERHRIAAKIFYALAYPVYRLSRIGAKRGASVMGGNLIVRRKALEAAGGYNTEIPFYGDDTDTAARLSKLGLVKFDYDFAVPSSGRRLVKEGLLKTGFNYAINYFWITLFKKPFHKK